jgi:hypothetical protein
MGFRLRAFGLHLLGSVSVLTLILGALYLGWYRWPGWYLTNVTTVVLVMIGVDVVIGPLLTFVIANPSKSRRELKRDIGIIVAAQLCALVYGSVSLWNGRPLYYGFADKMPQAIQAYDLETSDAEEGRRLNPELAPHWYTLPRWVWEPSVSGDGIFKPRYFKPWDQGLPTLQKKLEKMSDSRYFLPFEKRSLERQMKASGLPVDQQNTLPLTGRGRPALIVFEPNTLKILAILRPK